jgi:glycosyltransferase involved in cell wall biosynthesis
MRAADIPAGVRVMHVAGAQHAKWLVSICQQLRALGYDVEAIIGNPDNDLAAELRAAGVPFRSLPLTFAPHRGRSRVLAYIFHLPVAVWRLARLFRRERPDIVHTHIFASIFVGRLAAWLARVPHRVAMVPGPLHLEAPMTRWADRLTWWMDHRVVAGSGWTRDRYQALGLRPPRLECISYGADAVQFDPARVDRGRLRRELGIADGTPLVGLVAYFYPPKHGWQTPPFMRGRGLKGHEDLLAAVRLVRQRMPKARFVLVGSGSNAEGERYRERLMARCREDALLAEAVIFTGPRDDIAEVLAGLDVAVQCSLSENYGGTIEALLMETPIVATRVGGMPETVRDGETGLLAPPADPEALAAAILRLLEAPEAARAMARAGRRLMLERFQIAHTATSIAALYQRMRDPQDPGP